MTRRDSRGQTTLDFTIGTSLFLLVLIGIFQFVPGILQPFTAGSQEDTVTVDRIADQLSTDLLGAPDSPYVLDRYCTVAFFENRTPDRCRYDGTTLTERIGVVERQNVNVTLRGNVTGSDGEDILCWDDGDEKLIEQGHTDCGTDELLTEGPTADSGTATTVTARRVVNVAGNDTELVVEMW